MLNFIRQHTPPLSSMVKTIKQQHRQLPVHRASILASKHLNGKKSAQIPCPVSSQLVPHRGILLRAKIK